MNMIIKKRQLVTATLVIALGAAVFVNWYYTKPSVQQADADSREGAVQESVLDVGGDNLGDARYVIATSNAGAPSAADEQPAQFSEWELRRSKAHDESAELLEGIIKDEKSDDAAVKAASEKLTKLAEQIKLEADAETLIAAKTGRGCMVMLDGESAQIIVPAKTLDNTVMIQIKDIIVNKTGISAKNITIIELNS